MADWAVNLITLIDKEGLSLKKWKVEKAIRSRIYICGLQVIVQLTKDLIGP
ncbi:uncharacterized protein KLLA0_D03333g [Kluyveromyces lactis]|uniref:KLLA0D03333p n=1 Tax=Kluyveromyces lactis (strain ATCC 8585 / CBS 2359 / DSM 70799 / NBRC 1267 / NRRL Y-1140 / WM37) TaxID=284590 RepID=B5FV72_KLULA|nr:uncharacterized protein KLLA0_D03333g [Kluyveromyces lactis]CAR64373.1 KLLA0D03333p [Kluyveromyces lactis]|eukprot:XP_002999369.1 uncharacterized protein KLLA0_D03333g [Kluyveromyces lactis]